MASPSAASRVFGIVELLEHILLQVGANTDITKEPAAQLFTLQRINSTFRNTIITSKILRRRMWLERSSKKSRFILVRLCWLFKQIRNPIDIDMSPDTIRDILAQKVHLTLEKSLVVPEGNPTRLLGAFASPTASWRHILAITSADFSLDIKILQSPDPQAYGTRAWKWLGGGGTPQIFERLTVKSGMGLGEVFDAYVALFEQKPRLRGESWFRVRVYPEDEDLKWEQFVYEPASVAGFEHAADCRDLGLPDWR